MAQADADRNLLIGILALQIDFVSREALIAAVSAWVRDKQKPLSQILVDQGAQLSVATGFMLEAKTSAPGQFTQAGEAVLMEFKEERTLNRQDSAGL